jgi:hypothetical protein
VRFSPTASIYLALEAKSMAYDDKIWHFTIHERLAIHYSNWAPVQARPRQTYNGAGEHGAFHTCAPAPMTLVG